jgi:uncharacterized protein YaiI (UPF0178 family)
LATKIWVDADACPKAAKEILFKAAQRTQISLTLVANQYIPHPRSPYIQALQVSHGFDVADNLIVERAEAGDIAITSDIPLAAELMEKQVQVINPRGELYDKDTIRQRLNMRDFMDQMRGSGVHTGGPSAYGPQQKQAFANQLDKLLARARK